MFAPVPTGTVLFITIACSADEGSSSITASTRDRSASPEYVGGVSTHTNSSRACSIRGATSSSKCRRSELRATRSARSGS